MKKAVVIISGVMLTLAYNAFVLWALFLAPWEMAL